MLAELRFNGAAVVVTGAGSGIGRATCEVFAELGATVILVGRRLDALRETQRLLTPFGVESECFSCDVSNETKVQALSADVGARWPAVKALINNAGASSLDRPLTELSGDSWNAVVASNLSSVFYMIKHFMPLLLAARSPAVVNVGSIAGGLMGFSNRPAHSATKGALVALTRELAVDYGPRGLRVNVISPGATASKPALIELFGRETDGMVHRSALKRVGQPLEIANAIAFMASDAASFLHGANVVVDGGRTIT